jgi:hypothetical protein
MATAAVQTANLFNLKGDGLTIEYSSSSITGKPQFQYSDGQANQTFTGNEIKVTKSDIGSLVTVTIRKSVDANFTTFTLLLPEIHMDGSETRFSTIGIETLHHFLASAPNLIKGPVETYQTHQLQGTARSVEF